MSCPPFETEAWERAKNLYLDDLNSDERKLFDGATPENLFYSASATQIQHQSSSRSRAAMQKLKPVVECLQNYGKAIDVFSNIEPLILCPIWGSIRVLLHVASEFEKYYDRLIQMFSEIGDVLPRLHDYERLFPNHQRLVHTISKVYLVLIEFCITAKSVFRSRKRQREVSVSWLPVSFWPRRLIWSPFAQRFNELLIELRKYEGITEKEVNLSHFAEEADMRLLFQKQKEISERSKIGITPFSCWEQAMELGLLARFLAYLPAEETRQRLFAMLSNIDHWNEHNLRSGKRHGSTGKWLMERVEFEAWHTSDSSSFLWCYGIPGSGKTILSTAVVDELSLDAQIRLAYFYCDYSQSNSLETTAILGSLVKQLLYWVQIPQDIASEIDRSYGYRPNTRKPTANELKSILLSAIKLYTGHRVCFVIDGIDECRIEERSKLLKLLKELAESNDIMVKIFVASRDEIDIMQQLEQYPSIRISEANNMDDISLFIRESMESKAMTQDIVVRDPKLLDDITNALIDGACGMFLWVTFQLHDICEANSDYRIRKILRELPKGLAETYIRILQKIMQEPERESMAPKILQWIVCAKRPLTMEELKEAIAFGPVDRSWDASKVPTDSKKLVRACANLITFDDDGNTLRLAHYTIQQFLLSAPADKSFAKFHFSLLEADVEVGKICVTYLSFSDFETQVTRTRPNRSSDAMRILESTVINQSLDLTGINRAVTSTYRYLHGMGQNQLREASTIDYDQHLGISKPQEPSLHEKYRLLNYVSHNWVWHTTNFTSKHVHAWHLFRRLALEKEEMAFNFRPWKNNSSPKNLPYRNLFLWAVYEGHVPLLNLLAQPPSGPQIHAYYNEMKTRQDPLFTAAVRDHRNVSHYLESFQISLVGILDECLGGFIDGVKILLSDGVDANTADPYGNTTLHNAAHNGHINTVLVLLQNGADISVANDYGTTPLHQAASGGHGGVVQTLLEEGAVVSATDSYGTTPLHQAANSGSDIAVQQLLLYGANVNAANDYGTMPLHVAANAGYFSIAELLLKKGAYATVPDSYGSTPLYLAENSGSDALVELLLQNDADASHGVTHAEQPLWAGSIGHKSRHIRHSTTEGHNTGSFFNDIQIFEGTPITGISKIMIRHCWCIDSLQVFYRPGGIQLPAHGGNGGYMHTFQLFPGEYISSIDGRSSNEITGLRFITNSGRQSPWYGRPRGAPFTWNVNPHESNHNFGLVYFSGKCDGFIKQLQAHFMKYPT